MFDKGHSIYLILKKIIGYERVLLWYSSLQLSRECSVELGLDFYSIFYNMIIMSNPPFNYFSLLLIKVNFYKAFFCWFLKSIVLNNRLKLISNLYYIPSFLIYSLSKLLHDSSSGSKVELSFMLQVWVLKSIYNFWGT